MILTKPKSPNLSLIPFSNLFVFSNGVPADLVGGLTLSNLGGVKQDFNDSGYCSKPTTTSSNSGANTGFATASSTSAKVFGLSELTVVGIVTFNDVTFPGESTLIRVENFSNLAGLLSLSIVPSTKQIKPLLATTGSTGWSAGSFFTYPKTLKNNVKYLFALRWANVNGSPIEVSLETLGSPVIFNSGGAGTGPTFSYDGVTRTTISSGQDPSLTPWQGDVTLVGLVQKRLSDQVLNAISVNPKLIFTNNRLIPVVYLATGNATATSTPPNITETAPTGSAIGTVSATGSGTLTVITETAPVATASATTNATGTGAATTITETALTGSATGTIAGNATGIGTLPLITETAPVATASATTNATGTGAATTITETALTGSATGTIAGNATGIGTLPLITETAPVATASATKNATGTGAATTITETALTGSATGTIAGNATGIGTLPLITETAPVATASATTNATGTGAATTITETALTGSATGTIAGNATGIGTLPLITETAPVATASATKNATGTGAATTITETALTGSATSTAAANATGIVSLAQITLTAPIFNANNLINNRALILKQLRDQIKSIPGIAGAWNQRIRPLRISYPGVIIYSEDDTSQPITIHPNPITETILNISISCYVLGTIDDEKIESDLENLAFLLRTTITPPANAANFALLNPGNPQIDEEDPKISVITLNYLAWYY